MRAPSRFVMNCQRGFTLIELSIVVAIMSVMVVMGLEGATALLGSRAYEETRVQLATLDAALVQYYRVNGYLPCPTKRDRTPLDAAYGTSECIPALQLPGWATIYAGTVPFRALNLPVSSSIDGYGDRINYMVTVGMTAWNTAQAASTAAASGSIEVRTGTLQQPCSTNCVQLAVIGGVTAPPSAAPVPGAVYFLFSSGADKRGAITRKGTVGAPCANANDTRIDSINCVRVTGVGTTNPAFGANVFYDSRFNTGTQDVNHFDDLVVWRVKGAL